MKEKFEKRRMFGKIKVTCKNDDGTSRVWETRKEDLCAAIIGIVESYHKKGYKITLRQLHYQLVSANQIVNHQSAYKKLGVVLDDLRYNGDIDWSIIEDRHRAVYLPDWSFDPTDALKDAANDYRLDRQQGQKTHIELWTEKDAITNIVHPVTSRYMVRLVVNKGYSSSSAMHKAYNRHVDAILKGKKVVILYLGDHDPSGLDMVRDIRTRLLLFISQGRHAERSFHDQAIVYCKAKKVSDQKLIKLYGDRDLFERMKGATEEELGMISKGLKTIYWLEKTDKFLLKPIGLTMDQIKEYNLPENPTKATDSRSDYYIKQFGETCWEVDALSIEQLSGIANDNITENMDMHAYHLMVIKENDEREKLKRFINTYNEEEDYLDEE